MSEKISCLLRVSSGCFNTLDMPNLIRSLRLMYKAKDEKMLHCCDAWGGQIRTEWRLLNVGGLQGYKFTAVTQTALSNFSVVELLIDPTVLMSEDAELGQINGRWVGRLEPERFVLECPEAGVCIKN